MMTSRKLSVLAASLCLSAAMATAQQSAEPFSSFPKKPNPSYRAFSSLQLGAEVGTMGLGMQFSTPLASFASLRTGFTYMPAIEVPMTFGIQVGDNPETSNRKFQKMSQLVYDNFGMELDDRIDMIGKPANFWNWNVIIDIYPLKNNRHWHISGGFYLGSSRIAKAYNTTEDMQSLLSVNIYNNMYSKFVNDRVNYYMEKGTDHYIPEIIYEVKLFDFSAMGDKYNVNWEPALLKMLYDRFKDTGEMGVHVGDYVNDVYYPEDVYIDVDDGDGNISQVLVHQKGDILHKAGDPYMMKPDANGMVKADMRVKRFKPYVGIGYEGNLLKNNDNWKVGFDCGVLFWGGSPTVTTHEGVDLIHDVKDINGKVGDYVDAIDKFKVWPMINLRFAYRLF